MVSKSAAHPVWLAGAWVCRKPLRAGHVGAEPLTGIGLQRISAACGDYHWGVETRAFGTADEAAGSAAAMLADGERLSRLWRYVFAQLLDDYTSVLRHEGAAAAARM